LDTDVRPGLARGEVERKYANLIAAGEGVRGYGALI